MPGKDILLSDGLRFYQEGGLSPVVVLLIELSGCLGPVTSGANGGNDGIPSPTRVVGGSETGSEHPSLESVLSGLATADNRTEYAAARDLSLRDGRVEVVVELDAGRTLPDEFDSAVTARHEHLVQAFVAVDDLVPLSEHENVSYVRVPGRAVTDSRTKATDT